MEVKSILCVDKIMNEFIGPWAKASFAVTKSYHKETQNNPIQTKNNFQIYMTISHFLCGLYFVLLISIMGMLGELL